MFLHSDAMSIGCWTDLASILALLDCFWTLSAALLGFPSPLGELFSLRDAPFSALEAVLDAILLFRVFWQRSGCLK